jgi:hypothetical protein
MSQRSIKIRVVKESAKTVTIRMLSLNREMPVPKAEFEARLESGMYEIVPLRTAPPPPLVEEIPEEEGQSATAEDMPNAEDTAEASSEEE